MAASDARQLAEDQLATAIAEEELRQLQHGDLQEHRDDWASSDPVAIGSPTTPLAIQSSRPTLLSDRSAGKDRTIFETETDLSRIRAGCRIVGSSSAAAIGAREQLANYVVGEGIDFAATAKPKATDTELAEAVAEVVQAAIDAFDEETVFRGDLDRELFDRVTVDGEAAIALLPQPDGTTVCRQIEPEQIAEPEDRSQGDLDSWLGCGHDSGRKPTKWTFGVHHDEADTQTVHGYHVMRDDNAGNFEYYHAKPCNLRDPVLHLIKANVTRNTLRGISDFYPVVDDIIRADVTLSNMGKSAAVSAAIAWIQKHAKGTTASTVSKLVKGNRDTHRTRQTRYGERQQDQTRYAGGSVMNIGGAQEITAGPVAQGASNFIMVISATLRMIGVRWAFPEFMMTGDASNGNMASLREAGTPFVKTAQQKQARFGREYRAIMWHVVEIARLGGWFDSLGMRSLRQIKSLVEIAATPPEVEQRDPMASASIAQIKLAMGYSKQSVFASLGDDAETERAQKATEPAHLDPAQSGALMGAIESCDTMEEAAKLCQTLLPL